MTRIGDSTGAAITNGPGKRGTRTSSHGRI